MKLLKPLVLLAFIFAFVCVKAQQVADITTGSKYLSEYQGLTLNTLNSPLVDSQTAVLVDAPGQRMIRVGKFLTIGGAVLLVGGVALMATADELYYRSTTTNGNTQTEGDIKGGLGVVMTVAGVGMIIPGAIVWSKGRKKYAEYKATGASLSLGINKHGAGVQLSF